jgi:TolB-like protein
MIYAFGRWELDADQFELRDKGSPKRVEPKVFDLLHLLVRNAGRIVSRDEVVDEVWQGRIVTEATISTCLKAARHAIGDDGRRQHLIQTVHARGLRFVGEVSSRDGHAADAAAPPAVDRLPPLSGKPVIAVLPFDNLSADIDGYFADGLTEDIITNLSRFRDLLVIARTSSFRYKGRPQHPSEVGRELGAGYIVEGSVRRAGGRIRVTAQLIDAASAVHLWANHYDRDLQDLFAVQDEVTRTIAATLGVTMQEVAQQRAMRKSAAEFDAYDCLLRARRYTVTLSQQLHAEARDLLERAIALDPSSADAHALLANVYLAEHRFEVNPQQESLQRALAMAQRSVALDPQNAYARCWLAIVYFFQGKNANFESEAERALKLNPNDPEILADIGHYLSFMGAFARGIELSRRAQQLNPLHPGWYWFSFARFHYDQQDYAETVADVERISLPHFYWTHLLQAASLGQMGDPAAPVALARIFDCKPDFSAARELRKWNAAPDDMEHLMAGLRRAGLQE